MAYEKWSTVDGEFTVDWEIVRRLIRSHEVARAPKPFRPVNVVNSNWYNPFSWSLPDITTVDIDWNKVRRQVEKTTEAEFNKMSNLSLFKGMRREAQKLLEKVRQTKVLKKDFLVKMRSVQSANARNIKKAVDAYDGHIAKAKFVRNTSATGLMVGATLLSGGTAAAAIASGSSLKGVAKFQDTGNIGAAAMEAGGTLVFSLIPVKGPKGETLMTVVEAGWETGIGLVEGKAFSEALATGAIKLTGPLTEKVFQSNAVKEMLGRVVIPVKPNVRIALSKLGVNYSSKLTGKMAQAELEKHGGKLATAMLGKNKEKKRSIAGRGEVVDKLILDDELLVKFAIVNMNKGIGRGW